MSECKCYIPNGRQVDASEMHDPGCPLKLPSITDKMNQEPVILDFEGFTVRPYDGWNLWFENPHGEGTTIRKDFFLAALIKLFKSNF